MHNYKTIARETLYTEIDGLQKLDSIIDDIFSSLADKIFSIRGKVVLSGMGKSGHIAKKISATLSSTGTASFFVHPAEASHGDLGMIGTEDLIILLSNSGETNELKDIIYYAKRYRIPLACFVGKKDSTLANASDFPIILPNFREALDFAAPTTSTTMMLVLGDMLAMSLAKAKNFSRDDFQIFHPGGRLGSSFLKISQIMHSIEKTPIINSNESMSKAIEVINKFKMGFVAITDNSKKVIGIITDGVIRNKLHLDILSKNVNEIMTKNPCTIQENSLVIEALDLMNSKEITNLPVVDKNNIIIGSIHMHDCLKSGANPKI